jgi:hypothetical protein
LLHLSHEPVFIVVLNGGPKKAPTNSACNGALLLEVSKCLTKSPSRSIMPPQSSLCALLNWFDENFCKAKAMLEFHWPISDHVLYLRLNLLITWIFLIQC